MILSFFLSYKGENQSFGQVLGRQQGKILAFSLSSVPFHAIWKPRNCIAGISSKKKAFACEVVKMACEKIGSKVQDENCLLHFNKYSARHALFPQYHL